MSQGEPLGVDAGVTRPTRIDVIGEFLLQTKADFVMSASPPFLKRVDAGVTRSCLG